MTFALLPISGRELREQLSRPLDKHPLADFLGRGFLTPQPHLGSWVGANFSHCTAVLLGGVRVHITDH